MVHVEHDWFEDEVPPYDALLTVECHSILNNFSENPLSCCFIIKPYLSSMEDMTEEEETEFQKVIETLMWTKEMDFYNKYHFDYRGLIPMGLAIRVTKENNPYKIIKS